MPISAGLGSFTKGSLAMGVAFQLRDEFTQNAMAIKASMQSLDVYTSTMASRMNQSMTMIRGGFMAVALGAGILVPTMSALSKAGDYEQLNIAMGSMLKSQEKGAMLMKAMDQFAKVTPFNVAPVREAGRMLVGFGMNAERVVPTLRLLGNVASGVGIDIREMAEVYGRNLQLPHLYMRDIWQMAVRGIPIVGALAKVMHVANDQVQHLVQTGAVGIPQMEEAFREMGEGTGLFAGLMEKQSHTMKGAWSNIQDAMYLALQAWGLKLLPLVERLIPVMQALVSKFTAFAESPIGGVILQLVSVLGVLLVVGGLMMILFGGMRYMLYGLVLAFGDLTRAQLTEIFVQQGVIAGFRAMAVAAWASLGPYILIAVAVAAVVAIFYGLVKALQSANPAIVAFGAAVLFALGPIGWIIGGIVLMRRALDAFDNASAYGPREGGFIGWLQRIGGVIRGTIELWRSWDPKTKTFSLGEDLYNKLNSMGILQTVLNIATWLGRIRVLLGGIKDGFMEVMHYAKSAITSFIDSLQPAASFFDSIGINISKAKSSLESWAHAGKMIGYMLGGALIGLVATFLVLGVVSLLVLAAMLVTIGLVVGAVMLLVWLIKKIVTGFMDLYTWVGKVAEQFGTWIMEGISRFVQWIMDLPSMLYTAGVNMITSLINGIMASIPALKAAMDIIAPSISWMIPDVGGKTEARAVPAQVGPSVNRSGSYMAPGNFGPQARSRSDSRSTTNHIHVHVGNKLLQSFIRGVDEDDSDRNNE